ncbi:MAG TPA: hypothetical protein VNV85_16955 [Puia sp.]|jgi:hypothetical protein|nr:hypothetical protein [Puia sp.]
MRKIFVCILLSQQILLNAYSQNLKDNGYVYVSVGASIPVGSYGSTNLSNDQSGFAGPGGNISLSYSRLLGKKFGLAAEALGQINPLNIKAMEKSFSQQKFVEPYAISYNGQPPTPPPPVYVIYQNWNFNKKSWWSGSFLVGGYGQFPLSKPGNISLITKVMLGAIYLTAPSLTGSGHTDSSLVVVNQSKASGYGFAYSFGAGVNYDLNKKVCFFASAEYFATSNVRFKNVTESIVTVNGISGFVIIGGNYPPISEATATTNTSQKVSALNVSLGIGLKL